jgi:hypothetical protein
MSAVKWAALPAIAAGLLTGEVAVAAADEPVPTPTPTPPLTPASTPGPSSTPTATPAASGSPTPIIQTGSDATVVYLVTTTTTTTTTIVNAPITVVTAPITTINNSTGPGAPVLRPQRLVLNLSGCGGPKVPGPRGHPARVRLARNALLVVRVNHRRVASLQLPSSGRRGVPLRLRVARNGMLTIRRPSGRVVSVQGCTPN